MDNNEALGSHALARAELAPTGVLRAGINLSNGLLVTSRDAATGGPVGVAPSVAAELARRLGVAVRYEEYANPAALVAAVGGGAEGGAGQDIGVRAQEPGADA